MVLGEGHSILCKSAFHVLNLTRLIANVSTTKRARDLTSVQVFSWNNLIPR